MGRAVDVHEGGGTYELLNSSFFVPLAVRDLVRAELDGDGLLQVTGVACPGPFVMSWAVSASTDPQVIRSLADGWRGSGASWSEAMDTMIVTVWG